MRYRSLVVFIFMSLWIVAPLAPAGEAEDRAYRESQEAYQRSIAADQNARAAYDKERLITNAVVIAVIGGLICFAIIPMVRLQKKHAARSIEMAEETKKILEEIRELLKTKA